MVNSFLELGLSARDRNSTEKQFDASNSSSSSSSSTKHPKDEVWFVLESPRATGYGFFLTHTRGYPKGARYYGELDHEGRRCGFGRMKMENGK